MFFDNKVYAANAQGEKLFLLPKMANRHGLITGATGTGKTVTMKVVAESFSDMGVPVFLADVKGDVSGLSEPGLDSEGMQKRIDRFDLRECWNYRGYPVAFWDIFGEKGMELIDLKDLRSMLTYVNDNRGSLVTTYGNVTPQSIGAIQRALLRLEDEGGNIFFGEPSISVSDLLRLDENGHGLLNILDSTKLIRSPLIYSTFLIWLVSELFERLPEVGDPEKPKAVFFFDEAHLLFQNAPKAFLEKIVQLVKLIRSKGVGIYFVSQSPSDIPGDVLAQLSNRIQHGLRAYTPSEMKAVKAAANSFRPNPNLDSEKEILSLGTGEALVSLLDEKGIPAMVERANILPPQSLMGIAQEETREKVLDSDPLFASYKEAVDNYSAYEKLKEESDAKEQAALAEAEKKAAEKKEADQKKADASKKKKQSSVGKAAKKVAKTATNSILNRVGRKIGKAIARGLFGNWL